MKSDIIIRKVDGVYQCWAEGMEPHMLGFEVIGKSKRSPVQALQFFNYGLWEKESNWKKANHNAAVKAAGGFWKYCFGSKK